MATAVITTLITATPAPAKEREHTPLAKPRYGKAKPFQSAKKAPKDPTRQAAETTRARANQKIQWPTATTAKVTLPTTANTPIPAAKLPITLAPPTSPKRQNRTTTPAIPTAPASAEVRILDRATTDRLGIDGVVLTVARSDQATSPATLTVGLDYQGFAHAYSGNWSSRLRMVQLPNCALTTPDKPACRATTPLPSTNNTQTQTVTAQVTTPQTTTRAAAPTVLALSAGTSSDQGTYEATQLSPSATWAGGGSNGDFTWSYPMDAVPAPAGPAPSLSIGYSAQSVDGRTSATSAQPSWVGEGFDLPTSYIERSYASCDDDGQDKKYDQCWKEDNASIVLNGKSSTLIKDKTTGKWHVQGNDGERVVLATGAENGDEGDAGTNGDTGEHWTVTTVDGTQYVFGKNRLPGWSTGKPETNSVWTVPVFGNNTGEPGYTAGTTFADRAKNQAWRWNLDYVVDPHGNAMTYWYDKETNYYAKNGTTGKGTEYVRGGHLKRIDYGQRTDTIFSTAQPAAARVTFTVAERCIPVTGGEPCTTLTKTNRNAWPDVPFDQICDKDKVCTDKLSPSFFSRKRLANVTTQIYKGTGTGVDADYRDVNTWALDHSFPDPGDGSSAGLWLKSIQHTGKVGTPISLPRVVFTGIQLHNRVDKTGDDVAPFIKWRVRTITSETGSTLTANYSDPECIAGTNVPTQLDSNTKRCYPVKWIPPSNPTPGTNPQPRTDWFHKYVVTQVTESDPTGGAPLKQTDYTYHDGAAWAYDDQSPITPAKYRTWGIWRGYEKVTTTTGEAAGTRSKTTSLHYRGMDGDKQSDGTTRKETLTDSQGTTVTDAEPFAGQVREHITYNGTTGAEVSGTITTPWSHTTATTTHSFGTVNAHIIRTAKEVKRTVLPGGSNSTFTTTTTHDTTSGLPLTVETDGAGRRDCTATKYATNTTAWILNLPKQVEKVAVGCQDTPKRTSDPQTTDVVSDQRTSYDGKPYGEAPTRGNATTKQRVTGYDTNGAAQLQTVSTAAYDTLGRPTTSWDTQGTRTRHIEYTPAIGGPVTSTKETNALGHTVTTEKIPDWDVNKASIDQNNGRTEMAYDALGRLTDVWLANRSTTQTPNSKFEYNLQRDKASWVVSKSLNNDGTSYQTSYAIYDALLRPRQTQTAGVGGGRVITETTYDTRGLEVETAAGYIDTTTPSGTLATLLTAAPAGTRKTYDGAGRPITDVTLKLGQEFSRTTTTYEGNATTVEPPNGAAAVREAVDSRGRLIEKREYDGNKATGAHTKLTYTYDKTDEITSVKDADGNTWAYGYDFLGRKISSSDPDAGTSRTEYNTLDQPTVTEDARGSIISHTYDLLGRPTGKLTGRIPEVNGTPTIDDTKYLARWTYDTIAKGHLTSAIRYDGGKNGKLYATTNASYDKLYRVLREQYTISTTEGALAGTGTYTITNSYNLDGTLQRRTIPAMGGLAQENLIYGYNDQRLPQTLQGLTGIVRSTAYLPAGERIRTTLGVSSTANWTELNDFYEDGTKRLIRRTVVSESRTGTDADTHHRYDQAGNPVEIDDRSTTTGDKQCFTYDGHRRLKTAWTTTATCATTPSSTNVGGIAPYWKSFTYDSAGNRQTATDHLATTGPATTTYTHSTKNGQTPRPHLLTNTTTTPASATHPNTNYTYDAAGNTLTRTTGTGTPDASTQTLEWGPENTLTKIAEADKTETSFLNDANGNRLIRRDATGTTLYLGETELRLNKATGTVEATRYYTHAGQTVALRTPTSLTWLSTDHNGTTSVQIDAATQAATRRYTQPFGEPRGTQPQSWAGEKGFVGGTQDPTGLTHLGARQYDTTTGRFISADPVVDLKDPQQINGYAYSNNNPVTFADPNGKFLFPILIGIVTVIIVNHVTTAINYRSQASSGSRNSQGSTSSSNTADSIIEHVKNMPHNNEPKNPGRLGWWRDFVTGGAVGTLGAVADTVDLGVKATPSCWMFGDCGEARNEYDKLVKKFGYNPNGEAEDAGAKAAQVVTVFSLPGIFRALSKKIVRGAGSEGADRGTVDVWDSIRPTAKNYKGTKLPQTFELRAGAVSVWVNSNATKHMAEYLQGASQRLASQGRVDLLAQQQLSSMQHAVNAATRHGVFLDEMHNVDGWELMFSRRHGERLPVLKHALMK
ncbi:RHS repeat-associated core domain-containing protein [Streptomyces sp. NPDC003860]